MQESDIPVIDQTAPPVAEVAPEPEVVVDMPKAASVEITDALKEEVEKVIETKEPEKVAEARVVEEKAVERRGWVDFAVLREKKQEKKRAKLEKILEFAGGKEFIANDDVEKLLHVSDATSTRYLAQLAKEGRLERIGDPKHASYRLKK